MAIALIAGIASAASAWAAAGFVFSAALWGAFAIGAGLSMVSRALMPKPDLGTQMGGRSVMTREAASSRKIIYGRARVGGNVVYLESTGTDNKYLWLVTAIAGHEIDAYEEVWFNDQKIWDGGSYVGNWGSYVDIGFYKGDQTSADNASQRGTASLVSNSTKWTDNHKLLDTAYMVVKLTYDQEQFAQGLPNISTVVRGKKVWHPNNSSLVWSQNPALCLRDYLTDTKYGLGESTANIASINTAFGVCDEAVALAAGGTQPRYTMDGVVDTADSIKANIENMTGAMIGRLIYSGGKFEIHAGEYVAPTVTIDESMMVGEISVQTKQSRRNAYNGVKGVFLSEEDNYILADYPAQISSTYATQDGDPIYLDMPLPYTVNNIRAQRIAKLALFRSRQQEAITIPCNLNAFKFKIGDNINVSNTRLGYSSKVFEVVGYSFGFSSDQMVVNVEAIETASSIWDWTTSDEEVFLGAGEVALYDGTTAAAPTNLTVTADSYLADDGTYSPYFNVTWDYSDDAFVDHYIVEWRTGSNDYYSQTTKTKPFEIRSLQQGASYDVRVKAVNEINVSSAYLTGSQTPATDTTAPDVPTSVSAVGEYRQITISWTNPTQKDLLGVEVFRSDTETGTYLYAGNGDSSFIDTDLETPKTYYYKVRSYDRSFNKSNYAAIVSATSRNVTITAPDNSDVVIYDGESGIPPSVTTAVATTSSDSNTFYLKQDYKEHLELHVSYPVGALTSGTVSGETNAINAVMSQFKFQIYYAPTSNPTSFTQFGSDLISQRKTTTGQLISNYFVKTTDLGSGNYKAELQTKTQVRTAYPTLSGYQLGVIDDDYNLTEITTVYDFPSGEYVFKVVVTVTDGSYSPYPATGSPSSTLARTAKAIGYQQVKKSGYSYAFEPYYQPTTIFRDRDSDEVVRLSDGADTLEIAAINAQGKPRLLMIGPNTTNPSSGVSWGASINFVTSFDSYSNGGLGEYQIGIDKSGTGLYLGSGGYRPQDSGGSELKITNGRTDVFGDLYLNGVEVGTGSGSISGVTAGTNLNGGGTSGTVTLNLDSTITGNHTFSNNLIVEGNLTVEGTTTTVDTDNLNVKDKNITLNYSTGDSSANANGAGITIQDAVNSTTNATILWDSTNDKFDFSHKLTTPSLDVGGNITVTGTVDGVDISTRDGILTTTTNTANSANTTANAALPKAGGTITGQVEFPSSVSNRPVLTGGFLSRQTSDGDADIWGISETYYPSQGGSDAWGIRWASSPNQIQFVGANANKVIFDLDNGAITSAGVITATGGTSTNWNTAYTYSQVGHLPLSGGTLTGGLSGTTASFSSTLSSGNITAGLIGAGGAPVSGYALYARGSIAQDSGSMLAFGNVVAGMGYVKAASGGSGGYYVASQQVIDGSRNLTNIGTITNDSTVVSKNLVTGLNNGTFSSVKTIGALHIANLSGSSGAARQSGITFQGDSATQAQAGIYVTNDNSSGTHMAFATTNNYSTGPQFGLTISNFGVVNIPRNALQFGGTTAIDANRNLTVGTISSGAITSTGIITSADFFKATGQNIKFSAGGTHVLNMDVNRKIYPATNNSTDLGHSGTLAFRTLYLTSGIYHNTSQILDSSRNLLNIGTISSAAITADGGATLNGVGTSSSTYPLRVFNGASTPDDLLSIKDDGTIIMDGPSAVVVNKGLGLSVSASLGVGGQIYNSSGDVEVSGDFKIASGGLKMGTASTTIEIIDASRNLTNIGTISSGAITATSYVKGLHHSVIAGNNNGIGFWDNITGASGSYAIYMSAQNGTYGGRVTGDTTSDYNMYFKMSAGTNRGFVFKNGSTNVAGIDGGGNGRFTGTISSGAITSSGGVTGTEGTFGTASGANVGMRLLSGTGTSDYARIRYYEGNLSTNRNTIHFFGRSWQGGGVGTTSTGAINIDGDYGVTFGAWNAVDAYIDTSGIHSGASKGYYVGSTQVIDASRNLTNIGSITATSNSGIGITPNTQKLVVGGLAHTRVQIDGSSTAGVYFTIGGANGATIRSGSTNNLQFYTTNLAATIDSSMNFNINSGALQVGGTTVIDASRNLTNIGTAKFNYGAVWSETTQGQATGTIHLDPNSGTDHAGSAITFGASDHSSGNVADAGIYVRSDGSYGTKMYLSTTDSYAAGSKTAIKIDHSGHVGIMRGSLLMGTNIVIDTSRIFYAQTRVEIQGSGGWAYTRLRNVGSVMWDIAANPADNSSALQFRPSGSGTNATLMSTSGNWTINGTINSGAITATSAYGGGSGDYINVTTPPLRIDGSTTYWRIPHESGHASVSGVYGYETGKNVYWGEPSDTGKYYFRGRDLSLESAELQIAGTTVIDASRKATFAASGIGVVGLEIDVDVGASITLGNDTSYGATGGGRYTTLGFGGTGNGTNRIFALNTALDGLYICSATSRNISFRTNGSGSDAFTMTAAGLFLVGGTTVIDASRNLTNIVNASTSKLTLVASTAANIENFASGTGTPTTNWRISGASSNIMTLHSGGNLAIAGTLSQNSDRRIKDNIAPITDALSKTCALQGSTYTRTDKGQDKDKVHAGLIAQDVEAVLPEAVGEIDGIKTIDYSSVIALLVESIKDLKSEVNDLKTQLSLKEI